MHKLIQLLLLTLVLFSPLANAQQFAAQYDEAAGAYQQLDYNKAEQIWASLATQGDANSQYAMAIMHLKKEVQAAQDTKAFGYLVAAAKQQHVAAMFNLGVAYWEGRGVSKQTTKALNWWEVAAQREDAGAQYNLGLAYHIGEGRTKDDEKALHWIQLAVDNGHPQAKSLLDSIQKKDLPESIQIEMAETDKVPSTQTIPEIPQASSQMNTASSEKIVESIPVVEAIQTISNNTDIASTSTTPPPTSKPTPDKNADKPADVIQTIPSNQLTELRAAPDINASSVATIKVGANVKTLETYETWSKVIIEKSYPVWVYADFLTDEGKGIGTIKGENVNIRPSPSTDNKTSPSLGHMNTGERVAIVLKRGSWVKIIPSQAFPAWVASKDIK